MVVKKTTRKIANVISDKCDKTRIVFLKYHIKNNLYKKTVTKRKRLMVHDPDNKSKIGDAVELVQCRPFSKKKRWRIINIISK